MNESLLSNITDSSIASRDTEVNSSYESQTTQENDLNNHIIKSICLNLSDIINENKANMLIKIYFIYLLFHLFHYMNILKES